MVKYAVWVSSSIESYEGLCYDYDGRTIFTSDKKEDAEEYAQWCRDDLGHMSNAKYTVVKVENVD